MICLACGQPYETTINGRCPGCSNNPFVVPTTNNPFVVPTTTIILPPVIVQPILVPTPVDPPPGKICPYCTSSEEPKEGCVCAEWCPNS